MKFQFNRIVTNVEYQDFYVEIKKAYLTGSKFETAVLGTTLVMQKHKNRTKKIAFEVMLLAIRTGIQVPSVVLVLDMCSIYEHLH